MARKYTVKDLAMAIEEGGSACVMVFMDDTVLATVRHCDCMGVEKEVDMGSVCDEMIRELEIFDIDVEYEGIL